MAEEQLIIHETDEANESVEEEVDRKKDNFLKSWDLAVWIAPFPIIGYAISFSYEYGVSIFFKYPISFISLEPTLIAKNSLYVLIISIVSVLITGIFHTVIGEEEIIVRNTKYRNSFLGIITMFNSLIIACLFLGRIPNARDLIIFGIPIAILITIVYTIYRTSKKKAYILRSIFILLIAILILPGVLGYSESASKTSYYIIEGKEKNYIVLNIVKDKMLIAPVNLKTRTFTPTYTLIETKTDFKTLDKKDGEQLTIIPVVTGSLSLSIDEVKTAKELLKSGD
ncbi:hypothetical protein ABC255_02485 [Neobacillus sp. 3P2-tot-E-2]|uniref:hypothetical protein n=1 Tax=Neobacillus sp. 3P2-tot-E-2 TaxID=3132212 RepID=UPI00399F1F71